MLKKNSLRILAILLCAGAAKADIIVDNYDLRSMGIVDLNGNTDYDASSVYYVEFQHLGGNFNIDVPLAGHIATDENNHPVTGYTKIRIMKKSPQVLQFNCKITDPGFGTNLYINIHKKTCDAVRSNPSN